MIDIDKLKKMRLDRKMFQREVAEELGISRVMYTLIENGKRNPSFGTMQKMVEFFGEEAKDIFFGGEVA